jgi:hypothetical protein
MLSLKNTGNLLVHVWSWDYQGDYQGVIIQAKRDLGFGNEG